jgi:hypothetical protein
MPVSACSLEQRYHVVMEVICGAPATKVAWLNHATVAPPVARVPVLCAQVTRAVTRVSTV